jgi:hypothetical protein
MPVLNVLHYPPSLRQLSSHGKTNIPLHRYPTLQSCISARNNPYVTPSTPNLVTFALHPSTLPSSPVTSNRKQCVRLSTYRLVSVVTRSVPSSGKLVPFVLPNARARADKQGGRFRGARYPVGRYLQGYCRFAVGTNQRLLQ